MDYKAKRLEKGLTLMQAAELSGFAFSTISGLERTGEGSERLKQKLDEIYGTRKTDATLQEDPPEYTTMRDELELWKRRAKVAEAALHKLERDLSRLSSFARNPHIAPMREEVEAVIRFAEGAEPERGESHSKPRGA